MSATATCSRALLKEFPFAEIAVGNCCQFAFAAKFHVNGI
ncbi:hypothetical protein T02_7572 [Trichinella nativa]|uniref:Uncharacterized protein n=1 Tax=Trichinella nativa TaxID=6335 RepID=A0A0V1KH30_9BILA|nr:hypothetical protein T02_7572 [Trichinella nativa]